VGVVNYPGMWWLGLAVAVGYTVFGVVMIRRRERFAHRGARFHQRIARAAPWAYRGRMGTAYTSEDFWRVLMVPLAVLIIVGGVAFGIVIAATT
jgi:hypothetical protein